MKTKPNLFADSLSLQVEDGLVLVQLRLQSHVLQLQLLDPHLQRLHICPNTPHPEKGYLSHFSLEKYQVVVQTQTDRRAVIGRGTLESRPKFPEKSFSRDARRCAAARPSNTSGQPSDTHDVCDPEILGQKRLKSVISVTLDISQAAHLPDIGSAVAKKCGAYISGWNHKGGGCAHIWQQLMVASLLEVTTDKGLLTWFTTTHTELFTQRLLALTHLLGLRSCYYTFVLTSALSTLSVCYMRGLFARVTFSLRVISTLHFACIFVLRSVFCFAGVQTLVYAPLFSRSGTQIEHDNIKNLEPKNTISLLKARQRNIGDSHPTIICKCP